MPVCRIRTSQRIAATLAFLRCTSRLRHPQFDSGAYGQPIVVKEFNAQHLYPSITRK